MITPHRAFARLHVGTKDVVACVCLTVILSLCWIRILPWVGSLWGRVFVYWTKALQLEGSVVMAPQQWGARIHFALPYLNASAGLQYMLHIYILRKSILFMPLLYFAFGPSLDVLIFVSLYSWGMSWKSKNRLVA